MALATKADLVASVARWLRRADLANDIPDFIALAEAQMQRKLRTADMISTLTPLTISAGYATLPTDFVGLRALYLNTSPITRLDFKGAQEMVRRGTIYFAAGKPTGFSVVGNQLQFSPIPDASYTGEITYWKRIPALSAPTDTNWLLTKHPDAYLYGTLLQSAPFLKADERLETWGRLFTAALADISSDDEWRNYGAAVAAKARSLG